MGKYKDQIDRYLFLITEFGIYLYIFLLFFDKGEGLRNIGLYGALTGWLVLSLFVKRTIISLDIVTCSFLIFLGSAIVSSLFSLEPIYSFHAIKSNVLPATITFLILSTFFNIRMILRLNKVICLSGLIILALGLQDYLSGKVVYYTSGNVFLSLDKNEYGFLVGLFFPFFLLFFIKSTLRWKKLLWGFSSTWGVFGTILSASRASIGNIFAVIGVFALFLVKRKHLKMIFVGILICTSLFIFSFKLWPEAVKRHISETPKHLSTFTFRTYRFWKPAIDSVKRRPLLGWGYGGKIYRDPRPFENSKQPYWKIKGGLHNTFITILFHQGIVGFLSYLFLLSSTSFLLIKIIRNKTDERKFLGIALLSIIVGSFFINSFVLSVPLERVAPILGMSSALVKNRQKSVAS